MRIGALAVATHTQAETIRFYEREGLLPIANRTDANYRTYGPEHVKRLGLIRRCRALDMSLDEIRALLAIWDGPSGPCNRVNALIDTHIEHVHSRIRELEGLRQELQALRERCELPSGLQNCGILEGLLELSPSSPTSPSSRSHVDPSHRRHR